MNPAAFATGNGLVNIAMKRNQGVQHGKAAGCGKFDHGNG